MKISSKKSKVLIGIVVVVLVIVLLNVFQKEVRTFFYSISAPIQKVLWGAGDRVSDFFESLIRTGKLKSEMDELKLKNQELLSQIAVLKEVENENRVLREALEIELQKDFELIVSRITGKDISQDFILINKGSEDGVSQNMPVITQQKVLLGKISQVYENFSKVMLISNKKSSFDAKILASEEGKEDISGVIKGQGNFKILLDLLPRDKEINQGDIVISSWLGGVFPGELLIGEVKKVKKSDIDLFQKAEVEPFFDISQAEILFIISSF